MISRPPVVTILGHVDHGKTTLLDYIRKSNVAGKEHGGITQKIGGYEVATGIKGYKTDKITFIDTPGHEAFSLLRARGATVADIAILIIDAKDSIMPQTIESISHIKNAKIPYIVALNKTDLPEANPEKVKRDLIKYDVLTENQGGDVPAINISAKTGKGVDELLEAILLLAADKNLTYNPKHPPQAYIIENKKDRRGIVVGAIIKNGQLKVGDIVYSDNKKSKIRSLINDQGRSIKEVIPCAPFELLGFEQIPEVGSLITTELQEEKADIVNTQTADSNFNLEDFLETKEVERKRLSLIIKADSQGSLEAVTNSLIKNPNVDIIMKTVGNAHKSDVFLAKTSNAIIIGFNIAIDPETRDLAKQEKVIIKTYDIIYELLEELNEVANLLEEKEKQERNLKGEAKVLASFIIENEKVVGVKITKGKINLGDQLEIYRNDNMIGKTRLVSLQVRAKKVEEVKKDQESGMILSPPLDIRTGDVIKSIL